MERTLLVLFCLNPRTGPTAKKGKYATVVSTQHYILLLNYLRVDGWSLNYKETKRLTSILQFIPEIENTNFIKQMCTELD